MRVNFNWLLHPDWRYILIITELLIVLSITQSVISLSADLSKDMLMLDIAFLIPLIAGYPAYKILKKRNHNSAENVLTIAAVTELAAVSYFLYLFSFMF